MKLFFKDEQGYLLKACLIEYRNLKMQRLSQLMRDYEKHYQDCSRLNWEIDQLNIMIDNYEKALMAIFCK